MKNYYELLELPPTASQEEIKRAFRLQIARYHPDKVQHLGKEFQEMAAGRAAELTELYRMLSDEGRRAEYDRARGGTAPAQPQPAPPEAAPRSSQPAQAHGAPEPPPPEAGEPPPPGGQGSKWFAQERASRDEYVRKATMGRFEKALTLAVGDSYASTTVRGFDFARSPKPTFFGRAKGPMLLARYVTAVDAAAVSEAWSLAKGGARPTDEICVFLFGSGMASRGELEKAIFDQRRKGGGAAKLTLIPIDARNWDAHIPVDAPPIVKTLLTRLRSGS